MTLRFIEYLLTSPAICLGERKKKGTYRHSVLTIPYSQITGALIAAKGGAADVHAAGWFVQPEPLDPASVHHHTETHVYSRRDLVTGAAVLPIETRLLTDVRARVFVICNSFTIRWEKETILLSMGAYRTKGLGRCVLKFKGYHDIHQKDIVEGRLRTRIPESLLEAFGIESVYQPVYGYLFEPDERYESGQYVRSLMEDSVVIGPRYLVRPF